MLSGEEETLFYLERDKRKYGIEKEYAVLLTSLHRMHRSAIATDPVGALDEAQFRVICERLVKFCDLDLSNLIPRKAGNLVTPRAAPGSSLVHALWRSRLALAAYRAAVRARRRLRATGFAGPLPPPPRSWCRPSRRAIWRIWWRSPAPTSVTPTPWLPARPVRPIRWM